MKHHIRKQLIDLTFSNKKDAYRVQQLVSEKYWNNIIAVLQKSFDLVSDPGEVVQIEKLEIDLGIIGERDIELGRWDDIIFKKLTEQLSLLTRNPAASPLVTIRDRKLSIVQQWLYYMLYGYLPFNAPVPNKQWLLDVLSSFASDYASITELRMLIHQSDTATERIILQHNTAFVVALLESLTSQPQKELPGIINELAEIIIWKEEQSNVKTEGGQSAITLHLWCEVLQIAAAGTFIIKKETVIPYMVLHYQLAETTERPYPARFLSKKRITSRFLRERKKGKPFNDKEQSINEIPAGSQGQDMDKIQGENIQQAENISPRAPLNKIDNTKQLQSQPEIATPGLGKNTEEESIYVTNAGLILLHPFLSRFFSNLSLLSDDRFADLRAHQKALMILHFLATGETSAEEHDLVTAKILCAYPLHKPVEKEIILEEGEIKEAADLMENIVGQWDILGNTSADGLREGFLQRNGRYTSRNGKANLFVEPHSIDMLLDHIPWSISMVKLPWMTDILWVDWR